MNIYVEINLSKNKRNILRTIVPMYASLDSIIELKNLKIDKIISNMYIK